MINGGGIEGEEGEGHPPSPVSVIDKTRPRPHRKVLPDARITERRNGDVARVRCRGGVRRDVSWLSIGERSGCCEGCR